MLVKYFMILAEALGIPFFISGLQLQCVELDMHEKLVVCLVLVMLLGKMETQKYYSIQF